MIRVLRILEYEFESNKEAQADLENWTVPENGSIRFGTKTIRSAVIIDLNSRPVKIQND